MEQSNCEVYALDRLIILNQFIYSSYWWRNFTSNNNIKYNKIALISFSYSTDLWVPLYSNIFLIIQNLKEFGQSVKFSPFPLWFTDSNVFADLDLESIILWILALNTEQWTVNTVLILFRKANLLIFIWSMTYSNLVLTTGY